MKRKDDSAKAKNSGKSIQENAEVDLCSFNPQQIIEDIEISYEIFPKRVPRQKDNYTDADLARYLFFCQEVEIRPLGIKILKTFEDIEVGDEVVPSDYFNLTSFARLVYAVDINQWFRKVSVETQINDISAKSRTPALLRLKGNKCVNTLRGTWVNADILCFFLFDNSQEFRSWAVGQLTNTFMANIKPVK